MAGQYEAQQYLREFAVFKLVVTLVPDYKLSSSKLQVFAETLTEILDNQHKVLVFSQFVDHLALVRQYLELQQIRYQYLDGSTPVAERQKRVNAFQHLQLQAIKSFIRPIE